MSVTVREWAMRETLGLQKEAEYCYRVSRHARETGQLDTAVMYQHMAAWRSRSARIFMGIESPVGGERTR